MELFNPVHHVLEQIHWHQSNNRRPVKVRMGAFWIDSIPEYMEALTLHKQGKVAEVPVSRYRLQQLCGLPVEEDLQLGTRIVVDAEPKRYI